MGVAYQSEQRAKDSISSNKRKFHIVIASSTPRDRTHATKVERDLKAIKEVCATDFERSANIRIGKITNALRETKLGKRAGFDGIHPEFFVDCGVYTKQ